MDTGFIKIDFDMKAAKASLKRFEKSQFPFVYAKSLTETAEGARQGVGIQSRRVFQLHGNFIPRNIKKSPAKKSDIVNYGLAESAVFTGRRLDGWMGLHETGGTKRPSGKKLALPGAGIKKLSYKTRTGKTKKRYKPATLLKRYNESKKIPRTRKVGRGGRKRTPFIIEAKSGKLMIVRRISRKRYPLEILHLFADSSRIDRQWGFEKKVKQVVDFSFRKKFERNMKMALATAR